MGWDRELGRIYAELEEELSRLAPPCKACGQCCHFHTFGHALFSSNIEVEYIIKNPDKFKLIATIEEDYSNFYDKKDVARTDETYVYSVKR